MHMRYACGLLLNCFPSFVKISCFKGLNLKIYVEEDSATENENIENGEIDEQHKFLLDAHFVWILQKLAEVVE